MFIGLNYLVDGSDVWERGIVVVLDQVLNSHWTLPINSFDVKAEVAIHQGCRSCD